MQSNWPAKLWIVRHGESAGNVARDAAQAIGQTTIDIEFRDVDVPLSPLGEEQSASLGLWFAAMSRDNRPEVILCSPYLRAVQTAEAIRSACGMSDLNAFVVDERLREKEFGILDRLTRRGIEELQPHQAELRTLLGKFYHRPPGGESWCDVILRLRSMLDTISLHYSGKRVLIVGHQVVVLCLRYLLEAMDEKSILEIDAKADVANCSVTDYEFSSSEARAARMRLKSYNFIVPLQKTGTPITTSPDTRVADASDSD